MAYAVLVKMITTECRRNFLSVVESGHELWKAITKWCVPSKLDYIYECYLKLLQIEFKEREPILFIEKLLFLEKELTAQGCTIDPKC